MKQATQTMLAVVLMALCISGVAAVAVSSDATAISVNFESEEPLQTVEAAPTLPPLKPSGDVLVSAFQQTNGAINALELRNMTTGFVDLSRVVIVTRYVTSEHETDCEITLEGYLPARQYLTLVQPKLADGNVFYPIDMICDAEGELQDITVIEAGEQVERVDVPQAELSGRWVRNTTATDTPTRTGLFDSDFPASDSPPRGFFHQPLYVPPLEAPLEIIEVLAAPNACALNDDAIECTPYVKVRGTSSSATDLSQYRLRAGSPATASTAANTTNLSGIVQPGESYIIRGSDSESMYLSASSGAVWFEDRYGLASYHAESTMIPYEGANTVAHTGMSWALDDKLNTWRWGIPSPGGENQFPVAAMGNGSVGEPSELKPCAADQFRNPETNRCKKRISSTSELVPCDPGQVRNPETNRCRSIASATSTLKPCAPDQTRNPETNRCKKTVAAANELKPCAENQERNPETNRCRKVASTSVPDADFPVEAIEDSATAFAGWWALGGIGFVALAYAGWEWRYELRTGTRRIAAAFSRGK